MIDINAKFSLIKGPKKQWSAGGLRDVSPPKTLLRLNRTTITMLGVFGSGNTAPGLAATQSCVNPVHCTSKDTAFACYDNSYIGACGSAIVVNGKNNCGGGGGGGGDVSMYCSAVERCISDLCSLAHGYEC